MGYLLTVTNALSHVTAITSHTARGLPLVMKDANGVDTHLTYHPRGWLASSTVKSGQGDVTTQFEYDQMGQLTRVTRPDGSVLNYEYDAAHRVTAISNALGERIDYTLNVAGNRTSETIKSSTGTIVRTQSHTFDSLSRLLTQIGASEQTTTYAYDANGNTVSITDPLNRTTQQAFDALNRLVKVTDPLTGEADYAYNGQDNASPAVTDQRNLTTTYVYNGFGDVIQLTSPDTGVTTYQTDYGRKPHATDRCSQCRDDLYLRCLKPHHDHAVSQPPQRKMSPMRTTLRRQATWAKAVITSLTDQSGSTTYIYDDRGNVITDTRVIGSQTHTTQYAYDLADNLTQVTYPSGRLVLTYQRDTQGRVTTVTTQANGSGAPTILASNITYQPFGPIDGAYVR